MDGYKIVSPCIIEPNSSQCHWKTMHCWNSTTVRDVEWIDFQCPLIHRDIIETIQKFDDELIYGWGNDVYSGLVCKENKWKMGVVDYCPVLHLSGETIRRTGNDDYNKIAMVGMIEFFKKIHRIDDLIRMREYAESYTYNE
jgi:hypothetical protein